MTTQQSTLRPRSGRAAFTLVELLVVIAIIAILLALLTPALDKAMTHASSAVCMTNLRTWSLAMRQYSLDSRGKAPDGVTNLQNYWWNRLAPYVGETNPQTTTYTRSNPRGTVVSWMRANICPETRMGLGEGVPLPFWGLEGNNFWGSVHKVWEWGFASLTGTAGSYGMNLWLLPELDQASGHKLANYWGRYTNVSGDAIVLGDSTWVGSWPLAGTDLPPKDTENGSASTDPGAIADPNGANIGGHMGRYVLNRHNLGRMAINLSFADTSAQNVRLGKLWDLRWHKNSDSERHNAFEKEYP